MDHRKQPLHYYEMFVDSVRISSSASSTTLDPETVPDSQMSQRVYRTPSSHAPQIPPPMPLPHAPAAPHGASHARAAGIHRFGCASISTIHFIYNRGSSCPTWTRRLDILDPDRPPITYWQVFLFLLILNFTSY